MYNGKFWLFLNFIFLTLCALPCARAEDQKREDPYAFRSFINYIPSPVQFPPALSPVAAPLEAGLKAEAAHKGSGAGDLNRAVDAAKKLEKGINRGYEDQLWFLRAMAHEGLGEEKEALRSYDRALQIRPNNLLARFRHGYVLKAAGQCNRAMPEFKEVAWQAKDLAFEMHYLIGECLMTLEKPEEAIKEFQTASQKNPNFLPVVRRMASTHEQLLAKAVDPHERAVLEGELTADLNAITKQVPDDREAALTLAKMLINVKDPFLESGKLTRAETLVKKLVDDSNFKDDAAAHVLVQTQLKQGKLDQAEKTLEGALQVNPSSAELAAAKQQLALEKAALAAPKDEATE